jgi:hypothetical protein
MHPPKCDDIDYIQFLIAAQRVYTCTEAARCQRTTEEAPAHDAFTRLLARQPPDTEALWQEVKGLIQRERGLLVLDDSTLDKPYARQIELVSRHWSGKHRRVVSGINLVSLLWTDGNAAIPCDGRVYHKPTDGQTKNQHFRAMLAQAYARGFTPACTLFDSWYSGLDNLKRLRSYGWHWLTRLKCNRLVNPDGSGNVAIEQVDIPAEGRVVHLKGYGFIKVFRTVATDGDAEYWATDDLAMSETQRQTLEQQAWAIEAYHRGLKQCCGVERAQVRKADEQKRHIFLSVRAFVRLEAHRLRTGISWYEAKTAIVREAIRQYLAQPTIQLTSTA